MVGKDLRHARVKVVLPLAESRLLSEEVVSLGLLPHVVEGYTLSHRPRPDLKHVTASSSAQHSTPKQPHARDAPSYLVSLYQVKIFPISLQALFEMSTLLLRPHRQFFCRGETTRQQHRLNSEPQASVS